MPVGTINATNAAGSAALQSAAAKRADQLNERFLTLLVAQMRNQTPLNPMNSSEVTSQIAQINTVSGINKLNKTLSSITDQIQTTQRLQATALIGRDVLVPGNEISVGKNEDGTSVTATPFGYELYQPAGKVEVTIINGLGETVYKTVYHNEPAGIHSYEWDGTNKSGDPVTGESYRVLVKAVDVDGNPIGVQPLTMGRVNGVVAGQNGPRLDLGPNGMVTLADIRQIIS